MNPTPDNEPQGKSTPTIDKAHPVIETLPVAKQECTGQCANCRRLQQEASARESS